MAAKLLHLHLLLHLRRSPAARTSSTTPFRLLFLPSKSRFLSTSVTPYPFQYEMIVSRPANSTNNPQRRARDPPKSKPDRSDMGFDEWVDNKLSTKNTDNPEPTMDKAKRKYYNKRRKRMYGESDTDDEDSNTSSRRGNDSDFIELKQEVVEFRTLHHREEELYFYDAFSYPWEKNKHYKMVYQMEKKYFPDQCFDKAFLDPGKPNVKSRDEKGVDVEEDKGLVFFDEKKNEVKDVGVGDVTEKKVEDFFKCLKKFPNEEDGGVAVQEPFLSTRSAGLPPRWDGPTGTVVLVNKPKGCVFFP